MLKSIIVVYRHFPKCCNNIVTTSLIGVRNAWYITQITGKTPSFGRCLKSLTRIYVVGTEQQNLSADTTHVIKLPNIKTIKYVSNKVRRNSNLIDCWIQFKKSSVVSRWNRTMLSKYIKLQVFVEIHVVNCKNRIRSLRYAFCYIIFFNWQLHLIYFGAINGYFRFHIFQNIQ